MGEVMNSHNRAAAIKACMDSQSMAHAANSLRKAARLVDVSEHPKRAEAVKVIEDIAQEYDNDADAIAEPYEGAKGALASVREGFKE